MNVTKTNFEFKKGVFDNSFNLIFLTIIGLPIILFRNGVLDLTFASFFFTLYGLSLFYSTIKIFKIKIIGDLTEYTNAFGKTKIIPNSKISYSQTYYIREKEIWDTEKQTLKLEIKFPTQKITLYKDKESDYDEIIEYCKANYNKFYDEQIKYTNYIIPAVIICLGVYFFFFTKNCFEKKKNDNLNEIQKYGYVKISGTYKDYETIGKGNSSVWFHLYEFPKFDFSPINFTKDKSKYYNLKTKGEKISIFISPNEYKKKIKKTTPLKFYDKYFLYNEVTAYKIE